ncbi:hypothetical protein [Salinirubrum litoreum]|uniref:Tat (Twin-arginine translocation) pathway signal sequence n=1 Tax=Salinirubrum litoreum TaxID=1126234 RepID=A0ABD5RE42_9EURY|nr:hypothetical protein [Salinirubrum litoreum]
MHREPTDSDVSRRQMIGGAAAVGVGLLAGCLGDDGEGGNQLDGGDSVGGSDSRLAYVRVANWDAVSHTFHVLVERDGDIVHWSSHELDGKGSEIPTETVDTSWADQAGSFVISVRVDDSEEWKTFDVAGRDGDCYGVEARVTDDGGQGLWYEENPDSCTAEEMTSDG